MSTSLAHTEPEPNKTTTPPNERYFMQTRSRFPKTMNEFNDKVLERHPKSDCDEFLYTTESARSNDVGVARSAIPFPSDALVCYFELTVLAGGRDRAVAIGMISPQSALNKQPGWSSETFGYHGDDGKIFHFTGMGKEWTGTAYAVGDTVGCGWQPVTGDVFFTLNGRFIDYAWRGEGTGTYHPAIGLHSANEKVSVNLGNVPFVFDIESFIADARSAHRNEVGLTWCGIDRRALLADYCQHRGLLKTMAKISDKKPSDRTEQRAQLVAAIIAGQHVTADDLTTATKALDGIESAIIRDAAMLVNSQHYLNLVESGARVEAMLFARREMGNLTDEQLLAHARAAMDGHAGSMGSPGGGSPVLPLPPRPDPSRPDPSRRGVAHREVHSVPVALVSCDLTPQRRMVTARLINRLLTEAELGCDRSMLEVLLVQCQTVHDAASGEMGWRMPAFTVPGLTVG